MRIPIPSVRWLRHLAVPIVASALAATNAAGQGTITGRVSAQASGDPLTETRVVVIGTNLFGVTGADGRYTIRSVPAGTFDVRVLRFGFVEMKTDQEAQAASAALNGQDYGGRPLTVNEAKPRTEGGRGGGGGGGGRGGYGGGRGGGGGGGRRY